MINRGRHNILGVMVHAVDYQAAVARVIEAAQAGKPLACTALAVHGVMTGVNDAEHRHRLNHLDLVVPDGQPVRWALNRIHGTKLSDRVYGPQWMERVCQAAAKQQLPIYLYGSQQQVLEPLANNLRQRFPGLEIAGMQPSRFRPLNAQEKADVVQQIRDSGAKIVFVGLGCPRQEVWAYEYREPLQMPILAVGAAFDFHAGSLAQAPPWMQRRGLEWLFRFRHEPRRLWKRYLLLNPAYLAMVAMQWSRLRRFDPASTQPPHDLLNYG